MAILLAHWGVFSISVSVACRKRPNELWLFFQMPAAVSAACLSLFASLVWYFVPLCRHDCLSAQRHTGRDGAAVPVAD